MAIRIMGDTMTLEIGHCVVATARFSEHAAADGDGAWIVSTHPARLFSRDRAITALSLAERLAIGYGDDDPFVRAWRMELFLCPASSTLRHYLKSTPATVILLSGASLFGQRHLLPVPAEQQPRLSVLLQEPS